MGIPILLMGESGTGKSTSIRSLSPDDTGLINVLGKPLPFRNKFKAHKTRNIAMVREMIKQATSKTVIVDDMGYLITDLYMKYSHGPEKLRDQYEVYKIIGSEVYGMITDVMEETPDDTVVFFIMHSTIENGELVPATIGKMLNEKINLVGMFAITLLSIVDGNEYQFIVNETPPAKTPQGMFSQVSIPNDLKMVDDAVREYYGLEPHKSGDKK